MIVKEVILCAGIVVKLVFGQTIAPVDFATTVAPQLLDQKSEITGLQKKIDDLDAYRLGPAVSRNTNILTALRTAATIMDGTSDIHRNVTAQRQWMENIKSEINTKHIPSMQAGLNDVRNTLGTQQTALQNMVTDELTNLWTSLDNKAFGPFTERIRNQTIAVIRNISVPINEIENFDNQTMPRLNETIDAADAAMNGTTAVFMRSLQITENQIQFVREQLPRLTEVLVPFWENETRSEVWDTIENIYDTMLNASRQVAAEAQAEMDGTLNGAKVVLYSRLNRTATEILGQLRDPSDYLADFKALEQMAQANAEFTANIGSIRDMLKDKLQVFTNRKEFMVKNIKPLVSGIGQRTAAIKHEYDTIVAQMGVQFNQSRDDQFLKISNFSDHLTSVFLASVNATYFDQIGQVRQRMTSLPGFMSNRLLVANQTLEDMLVRAGPRIEDMKTSIAAVAEQAKRTLDLARQAIQKLKQSTFNMISTQFSDMRNDMIFKLDGLETTVNKSKANFAKSNREVVALIAGLEGTMKNASDKAVGELVEGRGNNYKKFNNTALAVPDVTTRTDFINSESARNTTLNSLESDLGGFAQNLSDFRSAYNAKYNNVSDAFNVVQEGPFGTALRGRLQQMLADQKVVANANLSAVVKEYMARSDSLNSQLVAARGLIESTTNAFKSNVEKTSWKPQVTMDQIDNLVSSILDAATRSRITVSGTAQDLGAGFAKNASDEDAEVDRKIFESLAGSQNVWIKNISAMLDSTDGLGAISRLLNSVQSQLSGFSDDGSQYRGKAREVKEGLDSMEQLIKSAQNSLDINYAGLDRDGNAAQSDISLALAKLNVSAPQLVSQFAQKILNFKSGSSDLVDRKINETKKSISDKLKSIFFTTRDAVQDYVNYVNGSIYPSVDASMSFTEKQLSASAMELRKAKNRSEHLLHDGMEAAGFSHLKTVQAHRMLDNEAKRILAAANAEHRDAREFERKIETENLKFQTELVKNLTDFAQWFRVRVQAVNESLLADEAMANRTIELRGRAAEFNISHARKRAQKDLAEVVEALNKTELFQALDEVQKVRETLQARENQTHDVLGQIVASVNRTTESIGDKSVVYKEMVTKFGNIITALAREFPIFMKQETDAYTHGIQEEGRLLGEMIEKHDYKATDFKKEMDKLYFVPMLGDIIRETETNLLRSAQGIEAPKDYASEISDIKQELQELTQSHNQFIAEQRKRVHEVKMRRSQKSGKHHK
jgi:hypothetical protein